MTLRISKSVCTPHAPNLMLSPNVFHQLQFPVDMTDASLMSVYSHISGDLLVTAEVNSYQHAYLL